MRNITAAIALWLFVVNLGIAFGAGIYEHRIVVPRWITYSEGTGASWNPEAARQDDTGRRFWVFVTTVPLTLLTLANLAAAWRSDGPLRVWWLAAVFAALIDRALTFSYFIPAMVGLLNVPASAESAAAALRWSDLNYLRHAATLAAWLGSLKALTLYLASSALIQPC
jgi:hypothetical protein